MNNKVQKLAEEAKSYAMTRLDETGELHKYYDIYFNKFAELIIQESVDFLTEAACDYEAEVLRSYWDES